jgi:hypothetical protein
MRPALSCMTEAHRFHAAAREFGGLEGRDFHLPNDAQRAAIGHVAEREASVPIQSERKQALG